MSGEESEEGSFEECFFDGPVDVGEVQGGVGWVAGLGLYFGEGAGGVGSGGSVGRHGGVCLLLRLCTGGGGRACWCRSEVVSFSLGGLWVLCL